MEIDAFLAMPHRLGWKHEYWDGAARLSPSGTAVARFEIDTSESGMRTGESKEVERPRLVSPADQVALAELHANAFDTAPEFAGFSREQLLDESRRSIGGLFAEVAASHRPRRRIAHPSYVIECGGRVAAAIILVAGDGAPLIEPVMVCPHWQRRGLATTLLRASVAGLRRDGVATLQSRCHLANEASMAWHVRNGFREVPSYFAASCRRHHFVCQSRHFEAAGALDKAAAMLKNADYWARVCDATEPWAD
jgi:GNAT superfamily N-acetyltransferase